jgi:hypothetical protein
VLTREDLLATPEGPAALEAWENGDHSALEAEDRARTITELQEIIEDGCRDAPAVLGRNDLKEMADFVHSHLPSGECCQAVGV